MGTGWDPLGPGSQGPGSQWVPGTRVPMGPLAQALLVLV